MGAFSLGLTMANTAIRGLGFMAFAMAAWVVGAWILHPQLPTLTSSSLMNSNAHAFADLTERFLPLLAFPLGLQSKMAGGAVMLWAMFGVSAATTIAATALAAWLSWRGADRPALRWLIVALALGGVAISWFAFLRVWTPEWLESSLRSLDYVFMLAGYVGAWSLASCLAIYPEPNLEALTHSAVRAGTRSMSELAARRRAGVGIWRYWSWLPAEHFGLYGRTMVPELHGIRRLLQSRELVWMVVYSTLAAGSFLLLTGNFVGTPIWLILPATAVVSYLLMSVFDPVFMSRVEEFNRRDQSESMRVSASVWLHRALVGFPGFLVSILMASLTTYFWHHGGKFAPSVFAAMGFSLFILMGTGFVGLWTNWWGGNLEQRRAIGWVFLGTAGTVAVVLALQTMFGLVGILQVFHDRVPGGRMPPALEWQLSFLVVGVPTSLLAFVLSLWASILHRGSFDPALALRRGAGVIALGVVLTALFVAVEGAASSLIVTHLGMPSASGPIVAGTAVALGFQPLRERVERGVQRTMLRLLPPEAVADGERRNMAVLFTDLSGYTRLSETDEAEALVLAGVLHREAHVVADEFGGRIVKTIGDAVLCVFDSPEAALAAARSLHHRYRTEAARRELEVLPTHSGLHAGDVVVARDGDVFGTSVNLAARLLSLAGPDELIATFSVAEAAEGVGMPSEALPGRRFKNIAEPVDCLRFRWRED